MLRFFTLIIICTTLQSKTFSQDFDVLTSQIFFHGDTKKLDTTLLPFFNSRPELTFVKQTGWTVYPPTDGKGDPLPFQIFSFTTHPYFLSTFKSGRLMVITNKNSDTIIGMSLSISFSSLQTFDSTYKSVKKLYSKYSSRTIKRPHIAQPFEVTKYLSKNNIDYIIVTKGESDNNPYIDIAYNFQGYDW